MFVVHELYLHDLAQRSIERSIEVTKEKQMNVCNILCGSFIVFFMLVL